MQKHRFTVLIEKDEDIYVASVPALPGCHTQASNLDDLEARIKEVIKLCLADKNANSLSVSNIPCTQTIRLI